MSVELDHPVVAAYVARLEEAAGALPPGMRAELVADIRAHLAEGLADVPTDDPAAVQELLDRLGEPADIVAEELREARLADPASVGLQVSASVPPDGTPLDGVPSDGGSPRDRSATARAGSWGPLEIAAVVLLTVGNVLLLVGPLLGMIFLWMSPRWTARQKWAGTGAGVVLLLMLLLLPVVVLGAATVSESVPVTVEDPLPTVSSSISISPTVGSS